MTSLLYTFQRLVIMYRLKFKFYTITYKAIVIRFYFFVPIFS